MTRIIGIQHRRKQTREGEARPTRVAIRENGAVVKTYELETDTEELDFLKGTYATEWRPVEGNESISAFAPHQCKWRKVKADEDVTALVAAHLRQRPDRKTGFPVTELCTKVPIAFDGLKPGDRVAMVLGGSGDRFAAALSRRGETIGAEVFRTPPLRAEGTPRRCRGGYRSRYPGEVAR